MWQILECLSSVTCVASFGQENRHSSWGVGINPLILRVKVLGNNLTTSVPPPQVNVGMGLLPLHLKIYFWAHSGHLSLCFGESRAFLTATVPNKCWWWRWYQITSWSQYSKNLKLQFLNSNFLSLWPLSSWQCTEQGRHKFFFRMFHGKYAPGVTSYS